MKQLDALGAYIATLHNTLGHDKTAAVLGQPPYNKNTCILCLRDAGLATTDDVIECLGVDTASAGSDTATTDLL